MYFGVRRHLSRSDRPRLCSVVDQAVGECSVKVVKMRLFWIFAIAMACLAAAASASPAPRPDNFFKELELLARRIRDSIESAGPAVDVILKGRAIARGEDIDEDN
ncbi:Cecropin-D [Eumeta japonica]|uniref:Cecropin-D n=1 Tax=Eumeta variegata TaxID=151549 RepID=A0A4C1V4C3_EUMVA|nr:Cecropin-D [Eumeta japonica]